jgi:hypothetical protein
MGMDARGRAARVDLCRFPRPRDAQTPAHADPQAAGEHWGIRSWCITRFGLAATPISPWDPTMTVDTVEFILERSIPTARQIPIDRARHIGALPSRGFHLGRVSNANHSRALRHRRKDGVRNPRMRARKSMPNSGRGELRFVRQDALPANLVSGGRLRFQTTIPASGRRSFLRRVHSSQRYPHGSSGFCGDRQPSTGIEVKMKVFLCRLHLRSLRNNAILDVTPRPQRFNRRAHEAPGADCGRSV